MSEFLKLLGIGLIALASLTFFKEYKKHIEQSVALCESFHSLLTHVRRKIDCYLTPAKSLLLDFSDDALEKCGFLARAREEGVREAYFALEKELGISSEAKEILHGVFRDFGRDYKDGTVKELDGGILSLEKHLAKEAAESEKSVKIAGTLTAAFALGVIILII